jgi:hypothetical protein
MIEAPVLPIEPNNVNNVRMEYGELAIDECKVFKKDTK